MDIYLVRHGEAAQKWWHSDDPGLSALGREQATQAAETLQSLVSKHQTLRLVSSPLLRARETAAPLTDSLGIGVEVDKVIREIPSPVPVRERRQWLGEFMHPHWNEQPEEVLEWQRASLRRWASLRRLLAMRQPTIVFTHFVTVNAVVGEIIGSTKTVCCLPANASITHIRLTGESLQLVALGEQLQTTVL